MILLQSSKHSINQIKRTLNPNHSTLLIRRTYSFESGRNRKPNRTPNEAQTSSTNEKPKPEESSDKKPVIRGHGRRHRSNTRSSITTTTSQTKLFLPFVPLPSDHLSHLRPKVLSLDQFFSLQRPLLEIELPSSERRSITLESRLDGSSEDESELNAPNNFSRDTITMGSPSDPSFKTPQSGNGSALQDYGADEGFEDELWGAVDGYAPYLITEPDGVDPDWPRELKHYLATASAFVPPPVPTPRLSLSEVDHSSDPKETTSKLTEEEQKLEQLRLHNIRFLAPYGTSIPEPTDSNESNIPLEENLQSSSSSTESGTLPDISQDPHSLMLQAARFLHSGLTSLRWPSVLEWEPVRNQLKAAQLTFSSDQNAAQEKEDVIEPIEAVRGQDPSSKKSSTKWLKLTIEHGSKGPETIINLDAEQLNRIISYSEKLVKEHLKQSLKSQADSQKEVRERFERLGEFLVRKHVQRNQDDQMMNQFKISITPMDDSGVLLGLGEEDKEVGEVVRMDSVQRKRKRKMKVHKYKKRRKAQRSLRKRQGRD